MKTKYLVNEDRLEVQLSSLRPSKIKSRKIEVDLVVDLTSTNQITKVYIQNFKEQMNQIVINDEEKVITIEAGDKFIAIIKDVESLFMLVVNDHWPSWNILNLKTGQMIYKKDIHDKNFLFKKLNEMNPTLVKSVTLNKE